MSQASHNIEAGHHFDGFSLDALLKFIQNVPSKEDFNKLEAKIEKKADSTEVEKISKKVDEKADISEFDKLEIKVERKVDIIDLNETNNKIIERANDTATKGDLNKLEIALKSDTNKLEVALKSDMHVLKSDISRLEGDIKELKTEMKSNFKWLMGTIIGTMFGLLSSTVGILVKLFMH